MSEPERSASLRVGVVVTREDVANTWQPHRWVPFAVLLGEANIEPWRELHREHGKTHFFAGTTELTLWRKETSDYVRNLSEDAPCVYIVLRRNEAADWPPLELHLATVSGGEAEIHLDSGDEIVGSVQMPVPMRAWVQRFIDTHHEPEVFRKRKRDRVDLEEQKFGKEPIFSSRLPGPQDDA